MSNVVTFEDLARMKKEILGQAAPASIVAEHQANVRFRRMMNADASIGRLLQGPQFIDDVAIDSGAVKASKLEANLVLSTSIIAGVASPGDRIELNSTGQKAYGTVSAVPNTQYYGLDSTGWFVGVAPNRITYTASTGVLTVPAAVITSLTIAAVGAGVVGGNYDTGSANPKLRLGTAGIEMWNAGGTKTVSLSSADGSFTLSNDPAGANRISIKDTGIELWKSSVQQFKLSTGTNAVEMILAGPSAGQYVGLNPTEGIWLGASTYAGASTKFRVSPLGVLQATSATISGAITATSGDLQTLSVSGTLTLGASGLLKTSATTTRVEMDNTGLYGYNAGVARFRVLNDGSGFLGASTTLAWTNAGAVTIAGFTANSTTLSSGAGGSAVSMSSGATAFSAGGGAFAVTSAGAVTASNIAITGTSTFAGTVTLPNGGSISTSAVDINGNTATPGTFSNMNLDGTTTIVSGGKIIDGDGSYWDQTGIVLKSSGAYGDSIRWNTSGSDTGTIYASSTTLIMAQGAQFSIGASISLGSTNWTLVDTGASGGLRSNGGYIEANARFHPANGTSYQSSRYLADNGTALTFTTPYLRISGSSSASNPVLYFDAAYTSGSTATWSGNGPGTANIASVTTSYFLINIGGTLYRVPFWANS